MVNIRLDFKEEDYNDGIAEITVKKEVCTLNDSFVKLIHTIKYSFTYDTWSWSWWWNSSSYYLYFKLKNEKPVFKYYTTEPKHVVDVVEVYYSTTHKDTPLVIGLKRKEPSNYQYYTYLYLNSIGSYTGYPRTGGFGSIELSQNLKEGLHALQKKITFKIGTGSQTNILEHNQHLGSGNKFIKHSFTRISNIRGPWYVYSENLFSLSPTTKVDSEVFNEVKSSGFDAIYVYYTNDNYPLVVEFSDGYINKTNYVRKDYEGKNWFKEGITTEIDQHKLDEIKTECEKWIAYHLDKDREYSKETIEVFKETKSDGYTVYKHISKKPLQLIMSDINYIESFQIVKNDKIVKNEDKLESLGGNIFKEIDMYSLDNNKNQHLLMKLTNKDGKKYFLYRFVINGDKWKQLSLDYLEEINIISKGQSKEFIQRMEGQGLGQWIERYINDSSKSENVKILLQDIYVSLHSILVLIDKLTGYGQSGIKEIIGDRGSEKAIPPVEIGDKIINIDDLEYGESGSCPKISGYKLVMHRLLSVGQEAVSKVKPLFIRLYLSNNRIMLYDVNKEKEIPIYLSYSMNATEFYVYLNNKKSKPLLITYDNKIYKPKDNNCVSWIRVNDIKDCASSNIDTLKSELNKIVGVVDSSTSSPTTGATDNSTSPNGDKEGQHHERGSGEGVGTSHQRDIGPSSGNSNTDKDQSSSKLPTTSGQNPDSHSGSKSETKEKSQIDQSGIEEKNEQGTSPSDLGSGHDPSCHGDDPFSCLPCYVNKHPIPFYSIVGAIGVVLISCTTISGCYIHRKCCRPKKVL